MATAHPKHQKHSRTNLDHPLSIHLSVYLPIIYPSTAPSIYLFYLPVYLSYLSYLPTYLSTYLPGLPIYLPVFMTICLCIHECMTLCRYLSVLQYLIVAARTSSAIDRRICSAGGTHCVCVYVGTLQMGVHSLRFGMNSCLCKTLRHAYMYVCVYR